MSLLKSFNTISEYDTAKGNGDVSYPNVSYIVEDDSVRYIDAPLFKFVDLGLPSGLKWATCNVGASKPEEFGLYFAWGETQGYTGITDEKQFSWADYKWSADADGTTMTKYPSDGSDVAPVSEEAAGLSVLLPEDDAATAVDSGCRMPTSGECQELIENTTSAWTTVNGVSGVSFTSNSNGNSIFVPAAGYCGGGSLGSVGQLGSLWSSSLYTEHPQGAFYLGFNSGDLGVDDVSRCFGISVRPVKE